MKFTMTYPSEEENAAEGFLDPAVLASLGGLAESSGFDGIALSEHPAPSAKWRASGGHDTLDLAVALGFLSAATSRIRLQSLLYVLPFHTPYLAAKALTTIDILSGGRLIAGVGAGYLRSEFSALGVPFEDRAALLDSHLDALVKIWTTPAEPVSGPDFTAVGPMWLQPPEQRPYPPIWIGGNSAAARRRVVAHGNGWCPIIAPPSMSASIRTSTIEDVPALSRAIRALSDDLERAGRDPSSVDIQVEAPLIDADDPAAVRRGQEQIEELAAAGVTWLIVHLDPSSPQAAEQSLLAYGQNVIAPQRAGTKETPHVG
ncbi:TIGR03619 family F420-dependent LLM class oxidoreductase [Gordonia hydrophobica]|uniref:TIGR03619 family F420-dependent LLM class oxidoreductase n=1 Tax=Gordonia hydrophobica TaxID=40516 RepID=A0ABZ2TZJ9_9ACTN|nr:TIGR03619 family F420-dependent LLM class oxidoreductase [Gordonia hydrophobica]MBM7369247.1 putative F420-dependent oxidoreductase [Gordonia hydrophobica]